MIWTKTPMAAGTALCAVCIGAAAALPMAVPADQLATTVRADADLMVNWGNLASTNAVPVYQVLANTSDPTTIMNALARLASTSGIPFLTAFGLTGNTDNLAGLDSLNAIPVYLDAQASGDVADLAGIDAFSAIPALQTIGSDPDPAAVRAAYYGLDSTSGLQAFDMWAASGYTDLSAFEPADDDPATPNVDESRNGYDALSGLATYQRANASGNIADLAGIDAFSAIPALQTIGSPTSTQQQIWDAQRDLDSVSAIPEYQDAPPAGTVPAPPVTPAADTLVATKSGPAEESAPAADSADGNKPGNGSYSGSFAPKELLVAGGGTGSNASGEGMRGYGAIANRLRAAVGLGPDSSTQGPADGADNDGGGDGDGE
jgi:hypothetical protein